MDRISNGSLTFTRQQLKFVEAEDEMQCDEEDSTIDNSVIHQTSIYSPQVSSDWATQRSYNSIVTTSSKGQSSKGGSKKVKIDDADSHCNDEDIDLDSYVTQDVQRIPVKILRKVIPKLRIAVYCSDMQIFGKKKLKHLWDERPNDWPEKVPFKDPNNASKDVKKPGKEELTPMFSFLKEKYLQNRSGVNQGGMKMMSDGDCDIYPVMAESSSSDRGAFYSSVSEKTLPILPNVRFSHPSNDTDAFGMSNVKLETRPAYIDIHDWQTISQQQQQETQFNPMQQQQHSSESNPLQYLTTTVGASASSSPSSSSSSSSSSFSPSASDVPRPVSELYGRLEQKENEVLRLAIANGPAVSALLAEVKQAVIQKLYDQIRRSDTRISLMFLDAGHQMEALLDVMLVLKQVDVSLLRNGCQEIVKKFKQEIVHFAIFDNPQPFDIGNGGTVTLRVGGGGGGGRDDKMDLASSSLFKELDLNLFEIKTSDEKRIIDDRMPTSDSSVPLFRRRDGAESIYTDGLLGIEPRPPFLLPMETDDKEFLRFPKELSVLGEVSPTNQNDEDLTSVLQDLIRQPLEDDSALMDPSSFFSNFRDDLTDVLEVIDNDLNLNHVLNEETVNALYDERSQFVPSYANKHTALIPSMVAECASDDSENEDVGIPIATKRTKQGRGITSGKAGYRTLQSIKASKEWESSFD